MLFSITEGKNRSNKVAPFQFNTTIAIFFTKII
ncbi:MAG: hypothetical protein ACI9KR_001143 [Arcticibacterium sp.]